LPSLVLIGLFRPLPPLYYSSEVLPLSSFPVPRGYDFPLAPDPPKARLRADCSCALPLPTRHPLRGSEYDGDRPCLICAPPPVIFSTASTIYPQRLTFFLGAPWEEVLRTTPPPPHNLVSQRPIYLTTAQPIPFAVPFHLCPTVPWSAEPPDVPFKVPRLAAPWDGRGPSLA